MDLPSTPTMRKKNVNTTTTQIRENTAASTQSYSADTYTRVLGLALDICSENIGTSPLPDKHATIALL